jgi:hypothetical protein
MGLFVGNCWSLPKAFLTACLGESALHGVTEYTGDKDRLLLVMFFTEKPGIVGSVARVWQLFRTATEARVQAHKHRVRNEDRMNCVRRRRSAPPEDNASS